MILLDVKDYCHTCPDFIPNTQETPNVYTGDGKIIISDYIVICKHKELCERHVRYLEQRRKENDHV